MLAGSGPGNLTYVVTVSNNGPDTASGVVLSEDLTLPVGVTVQSITPSQGTFTGAAWTVGTLALGSSATLTVVLTVDLSAPTRTNLIRNTATVMASNEALINTGDDSVTRSTSVLSGGSCLLTGDPSSGEQRELGCAGTPLSDNITITLKGKFIEVNYVRAVRFRTSFAADGVGRIIVYGLAGNDFIHVGSSDQNRVTVPTFLFGGPGNDHLHVEGGDSPDVLVGGDGDDHLETGTNRARPGQGRDVLIAGRGHDRIKASAGDNILIAGFTDFYADMSALAAIAAEWTRTGQDADPQKDYQTRVDHLLGLTSGGLNGLIRLNRTTVHDDGDFDVLDGFVPGASQKNQRDWFLANVDGDGDRKKKDRTGGVLAGEVVTDIDVR